MARIAGIDLPKNKRGEIGLTYIYGIGRSTAKEILAKAGIDEGKKVQDWTDDEQNTLRNIINDAFWFPQCVCPAVGLLDHKAVLFPVF